MEIKIGLEDKMPLIKDHLEDLKNAARKLTLVSYDLRNCGVDDITKFSGHMLKMGVDGIIMLAVDLDNFFDSPCKKKEE